MSDADCTPGREPRSVAASCLCFFKPEASHNGMFLFFVGHVPVHAVNTQYWWHCVLFVHKSLVHFVLTWLEGSQQPTCILCECWHAEIVSLNYCRKSKILCLSWSVEWGSRPPPPLHYSCHFPDEPQWARSPRSALVPPLGHTTMCSFLCEIACHDTDPSGQTLAQQNPSSKILLGTHSAGDVATEWLRTYGS